MLRKDVLIMATNKQKIAPTHSYVTHVGFRVHYSH